MTAKLTHADAHFSGLCGETMRAKGLGKLGAILLVIYDIQHLVLEESEE
ncbi:hypothetical protein [Pandoraea aquatica]|nr:hypothetical protein [Pandoraea aquatica]